MWCACSPHDVMTSCDVITGQHVLCTTTHAPWEHMRCIHRMCYAYTPSDEHAILWHAISGCATGGGGVMHHYTCPTGCRVGSMVHGTMLSTYCMYGTPYVRTTCTSTCRCTVSMHPQDVVCICTTGWHAILGVHHRRTLCDRVPQMRAYHHIMVPCKDRIPLPLGVRGYLVL